jgi:hypothetical protein
LPAQFRESSDGHRTLLAAFHAQSPAPTPFRSVVRRPSQTGRRRSTTRPTLRGG